MTDGADYTPRQAKALIEAGTVQLIDVRREHEHAAGRIAGSRLIELAHLNAQASGIDPERPVIVYCRSGGRSALAAEALLKAGYDAHNMTGGILEWQASGLPIEPSDGFIAEP